MRQALTSVVGTYGIAVLDARYPDRVVAARNGSPVVLGIGDKEMFVASDVAALVRYTRQVVHLDDGEVATVRADGYHTSTLDARTTTHEPLLIEADLRSYTADGYTHFMRKEIHEQPRTVERALRGRIEERFHTAHLGGLNIDAREARAIRRVKILGCGSAFYAGQVGAQLIEELARIPADAEPASEFRYRNPVVEPDTLYIAVSQSGETHDTLAAVQGAEAQGRPRDRRGQRGRQRHRPGVRRRGVPARRAGDLGHFHQDVHRDLRGVLAARPAPRADPRPVPGGRRARSWPGCMRCPGRSPQILAEEERDRGAGQGSHRLPRHVLRRAGSAGWPIAREGAQKLKEVSYLHAEAYPASELKHGPLALVGPELPTVADRARRRAARQEHLHAGRDQGAPRAGCSRSAMARWMPGSPTTWWRCPRTSPSWTRSCCRCRCNCSPTTPRSRSGNDVDKPRNLAKSVTVE